MALEDKDTPATPLLSIKLCWFYLAKGQAEGQCPWASCSLKVLDFIQIKRLASFSQYVYMYFELFKILHFNIFIDFYLHDQWTIGMAGKLFIMPFLYIFSTIK